MRFIELASPFHHVFKTHITILRTSKRLFAKRISSFDEAKAALSSLKNEVDNHVKLRIYALFKQATIGDCTTQKPGMLNVVEKAKWQAWNSLKSTSKEEAASKYVELVSELVSKEEAAAPTSPSTGSHGDIEVVLDQGGVLKLCLNRPSKKNAVTPEMYVEWTKTLNEAATNPGVKLVSVTGKGDYFSSGNDLNTFVKSIANGGSLTEMAKDARALLHRFVSAFIDFPKPLIGLINGPAVGIAVTTLGLYDYILASDTATFHTPFVALGQSPEGCSSYTFPRLMGTMKANEILLFGHRLTAHEAHSSGLITHVVPHSEFPLECDKLLKEMVQLPPQSLLYSKELMRVRDRERLHAVNNLECDRLMERWTGPECVQAVTNFFQRDKR